MKKAIFSAEIQELHQILDWVRAHLANKGFEAGKVRRIELALEEALMNVINHAYVGQKGKIEIGVGGSPGHVEIVIRDWGPPFDPLANASKINPQFSLEEREPGGLGIHLMRQITDKLLYRREEDSNVLIMRFSRTK